MILRGEHLYISEKEVRRLLMSTERIVGGLLRDLFVISPLTRLHHHNLPFSSLRLGLIMKIQQHFRVLEF